MEIVISVCSGSGMQCFLTEVLMPQLYTLEWDSVETISSHPGQIPLHLLQLSLHRA